MTRRKRQRGRKLDRRNHMVGVVSTVRRAVRRTMNNYSYTGVQKCKTLVNDMCIIAQQIQ